MIDNDIFYFAYGSNLNPERLKDRIRAFRSARRAHLPSYRLAFNKRGRGDAIYANIVPSPQGIVWGALYVCSPEAIKSLDYYEGVVTGDYEHATVNVCLDSGETLDALTYIAGSHVVCPESKPEAQYLNHILVGGKAHKLPEMYLLEVERLGSG